MKRSKACLGGRSRRPHVVDEDEGSVGGHAPGLERIGDRGAPRVDVQGRLRHGCPPANEEVSAEITAQHPRRTEPEPLGLVEAPLAQAPRMQRNRHDDEVARGTEIDREARGHGPPEELCRGPVSFVLRSVDQIPGRAEEGERGGEIGDIRGAREGIPQTEEVLIASWTWERITLDARPAARTRRREKETRETTGHRREDELHAAWRSLQRAYGAPAARPSSRIDAGTVLPSQIERDKAAW